MLAVALLTLWKRFMQQCAHAKYSRTSVTHALTTTAADPEASSSAPFASWLQPSNLWNGLFFHLTASEHEEEGGVVKHHASVQSELVSFSIVKAPSLGFETVTPRTFQPFLMAPSSRAARTAAIRDALPSLALIGVSHLAYYFAGGWNPR
eukprot:gnl/Hemi2/5462_TR1877_c0_g1_i1.p2 gnl/Hemi2/5462_TR1877_c0_g1~~gnl/Hemi2/5462_TR1877_c0_g1_i1.p2  ORF type:complete len:150 (+),score=41.64 gnl/Hemi2/5462_TR1877_c0_g1_i1:156-605(+)